MHALEAHLAQAARRTWPTLSAADLAAAVDNGVLAEGEHQAQDNATGNGEESSDFPRPEDTEGAGAASRPALAAAAELAQTVGQLESRLRPAWREASADWSGFGTVIPVLAGSPGAGASVLAAVVADALQLAEQSVLMVDAADPVRSGLAMAARTEGPWMVMVHPRVRIRFSWRARALLARLETTVPVIAPAMVPPPRFWRPPQRTVHVTVVDLGHDPWRLAAHPLAGAGAWLTRGSPSPRPIVAVRPSRPSLMLAEQVLARLDTWVAAGVATPPAQLVVMGARHWPEGVAGAAGRRVAALTGDAVFVPHDRELAASGVTAAVTPLRLRRAVAPLLRAWGLIPESKGGRS